MERKNQQITVLGAGVLGLTAAYQLALSQLYSVHVIAKSFPNDPDQDYTSQYAGANWRSVCENTDERMIHWETSTLAYFKDFSTKYPDLVNRCYAIDYFDDRKPDLNDKRVIRPDILAEQPWFHAICPEFRMLEAKELPDGAISGVTFDTVTLNAPEYVKWLYRECIDLGVTFEKTTLTDITSIASEIVVNCTGLGSQTLFGDDKLYPTRGQTILVKNTTNLNDTLSRVGQDYLSYLIPRPGDGGLIIGGCQQPHNSSYAVDHELAKHMLSWAKNLYPGIFPQEHQFEVLAHNVGLRPSRVGGARVELEVSANHKIIHGYGIGGWGYQTSWGIGENIVELVHVASKS